MLMNAHGCYRSDQKKACNEIQMICHIINDNKQNKKLYQNQIWQYNNHLIV